MPSFRASCLRNKCGSLQLAPKHINQIEYFAHVFGSALIPADHTSRERIDDDEIRHEVLALQSGKRGFCCTPPSAMAKCANENPAQGMGFGRRLSGVPKFLGDLGLGGRRYARGRLRGYAVHWHATSKGCFLTFRQPSAMQRARPCDASTLQRGPAQHTRQRPRGGTRRCRPPHP